MHRMKWLAVAGMLAMGAGCAHGYRRLPPPTDRSVTLVVRNERTGPMTVDALFASAVRRLGRVEAGATGEFALPAEVVRAGRVRFRASGFPGGTAVSEEVSIAVGDVVEFTVGGAVGTSILVRPNE